MLYSELSAYTNEQLSNYTHYELATMGTSGEVSYIFDRTLQDVERWRELRNKGWVGMTDLERREWMGEIYTSPAATKGMYTHNDLNRVESAVRTLSMRLTVLGYDHPTLSIKTDWVYGDNLWYDDMARYLGNVETLRSCIPVYPTTPETPSINDNLNYLLANDIEKILFDIDDITTNLTKNYYRVGEIISGEV